MLAIRVYRNYDNSKPVGFRILNPNTMETKDIEIKDLRNILKSNSNIVSNIELNNEGYPKFKDIDTGHKQKYYYRSFEKDYIVDYYCIITGYRHGLIDYIADTESGQILNGNNVTLVEIASALGISDIYKLRFYNASVTKSNNGPNIIIYNGNGYHRLTKTIEAKPKFIFSNEWEVEAYAPTQEGVFVNKIQHAIGAYEATIPNGVYHIENFYGNVNVLNLPISVVSLGEGCFEDLDDLLMVRLSPGIKIIPHSCFRNSAIQKIKFPMGLDEICESAFEDCCYLKGTISIDAKIIGKSAFATTPISYLRLYGTKIIGIEAFAACYKLKKIKIDEPLEIIEGGAFRYCEQIESLELPSTIKKIGKYAFADSRKIAEVRIPKSTVVSDKAFHRKTIIRRY